MDSDESAKILMMILSLPMASLLREQAELVSSDPTASIEDLRAVLEPFNPRSARGNDEQRATISRELCGLLDEEVKARKDARVAMRWFGRIMIIVVMLNVLNAALTIGREFQESISDAVITNIIVLTFPLCWFLWCDKRKLEQSRVMISALGCLTQPASIGSIALALTHRPLRSVAASALTKVIANLGPEHYGTLPGQTVPALCQALPQVDHDAKLAILSALTLIGDGRAIKTVERLSLYPPITEIGKAASDLLPILKQRELESKSSTQLLRASENTMSGQEELLRAVSGGKQDEPEVLVRAAGMEHE